jgi:hypothetical protein
MNLPKQIIKPLALQTNEYQLTSSKVSGMNKKSLRVIMPTTR